MRYTRNSLGKIKGGKVLVTRRRKAEVSEDDERLRDLKNLKVKGGKKVWVYLKFQERSGS